MTESNSTLASPTLVTASRLLKSDEEEKFTRTVGNTILPSLIHLPA